MKTKDLALLSGAVVFALSALLSNHTVYSQAKSDYTGSSGCIKCHPKQKKEWMDHGHAKMLRPVENGQAPKGAKVNLPEGMEWKDISYLVGGAKNYAQFIDKNGFIVTGPKAQWSMSGKTLTPYKKDTARGTCKYDCIKCHTVGWKASGAYECGVANSLEVIPGVWFENGVGCEGCHGPGSEHSKIDIKELQKLKKAKGDLKIAKSKKSELCGECHKRDDGNKLKLFSGDLVMNEQQYTEMKLNKKTKFKMKCLDCHDSHISSMTDKGIKMKCLDCHKGKYKIEVKIKAMSNLSCEDCHMPYAIRGAYDTMIQDYHQGDTRSHIFGISADPDYKLDDGSGYAALNEEGFARMTVEMTCGACHQSGKRHNMTRDELLKMAKKIH